MKILVTGSAGYIGSSLCLALKGAGFDAAGIDNFNDYYSPAIKRHSAAMLARVGIETLDADLASDALKDALSGVGGIVHLAAQPGISAATPWEDYHRNNIVATHRLVEAARAAGVKRFVNVATSSVYGLHATDAEEAAPKPASWYGATKLAAEQEVLAAHRGSGFPACSLRLFSVYGERERPEKLFPLAIGAIANDTEFPLFEGAWDHRRSFTYVGDICEGIVATLQQWDKAEGEIFNLGTDQCFTTGEAIETVQEVMGKKLKIKLLPPRPGDQKATHANIGKIRRVLGWEPRASLREGVERMVRWYRDEVQGKIDWR